ncbi:zinc-ribbon domain-containing protein [Halapricum desulfuricans]|uniref:Zinc-ribbon domain-containing protein n=1 Tax=Halapricum desulfuricans TaxID=2841257 RepID=A0A897N883_9EURY|nr:zinc-ribbon domain-containing protein [Halapricum desulfuricans]QSG08478.1 hypothetical protein HSR122_1077 [Halapricum desulfuricans]
MTTCPDCGASLPDEATFCSECGASVERTCPDCGTAVPAAANFCPNCRAELGPTTASQDGALRLKPHEFARRADAGELGSDSLWGKLTRRKQVSIEAGNEALFVHDGQVVERLGPGKHTLDSLGEQITSLQKTGDIAAILIERRETTVTLEASARTASEYPLDVAFELAIDVDDPMTLFTSLLSDRGTVTSRTFQQVLGGPIEDELEATMREYDREDVYGNRELKQRLAQNIERACRSALQRYGLRLVDLLSVSFVDDQDHIREANKDVEIREKEEDIKDDEARLDRRDRERETADSVHENEQRVRRETSEQAADHEIETQEIEHRHEKSDMERRHEHTAEREDVEHTEEIKTTKKEGEVERRELEHEQDVDEIEDLMHLKKKKDMDGLDVEEREDELEMRREEHEAEVEKERLRARDEVDLSTLASMDSVDEAVSEIAEIEAAEDLTPEQLEALGAKDSDELAKARQEAHNAEAERKRAEDQKEFREEIKDIAADSMDRVQETSESAMDNVSETGTAAAEDTSDNVIVSDPGRSDDGDTTIVQGGGSDSDGSNDSGTDRVVVCPECEAEVEPDDEFCLNCGHDLGGD